MNMFFKCYSANRYRPQLPVIYLLESLEKWQHRGGKNITKSVIILAVQL